MRSREKVAIITGAASGIGRKTAQLFSRDGTKVVVSDIDVNGGEQTVQFIEAAGGEASFVTGAYCPVDGGYLAR